MTLDEFIDEERQRVSSFVDMWHRETKKSPAFFPMEMEPGEWDEQLRAFMDLERKDWG